MGSRFRLRCCLRVCYLYQEDPDWLQQRPLPEIPVRSCLAQKRVYRPQLVFLLKADRAQAGDKKSPFVECRKDFFQVFQNGDSNVGKGTRFEGGQFHKTHIATELVDIVALASTWAGQGLPFRIIHFWARFLQEFDIKRPVFNGLIDGIDDAPGC